MRTTAVQCQCDYEYHAQSLIHRHTYSRAQYNTVNTTTAVLRLSHGDGGISSHIPPLTPPKAVIIISH